MIVVYFFVKNTICVFHCPYIGTYVANGQCWMGKKTECEKVVPIRFGNDSKNFRTIG